MTNILYKKIFLHKYNLLLISNLIIIIYIIVVVLKPLYLKKIV